MESLAYVVVTILTVQALIGLAAVTFSIVYRKTKKFKITSIICIGLLGVETLMAYTLARSVGAASLAFLVSAVLVRFIRIP